jgi:hypothetical protein
VHGFDEFFGYLYHLDAMSDPYWYDYPQDWIETRGPRNLVHCWATTTDDPTVMPRWGKVGKQKIVDERPLAPFPNMVGRQGWQQGRQARYNKRHLTKFLSSTQMPLWTPLDGYNQMDLLLGKGPSVRHEIFYFGGAQLGALRIDDFKFQFFQQPWGCPEKRPPPTCLRS